MSDTNKHFSGNETDVVIIGAGPVGLFQVFELGLQGIKAIVIDSLPHIGGQCRELYPQKPIFDIPALPQINALELIDNLAQQASPFNPEYLLDNRVIDINRLELEHKFLLTTDKGRHIRAKAVIIAAGGGSFEPVKLKIPGVEPLIDKQVFYRVSDLKQHQDKDLVILGGGDSAFDWALELQKVANSVTLIHRSARYRAAENSVQLVENLCSKLKMQLLTGQVSELITENNELKQLRVTGKDGVTRRIELDQLLVFFGLSPKLSLLKNWGLELHQNQIKVSTDSFETSLPGIYAVGDINWYPGKQKLILSGFHEAALAAFAIKSSLSDGKRVPLLYTTTSPIAHQRLGVNVELY
ncbi:NAD(P)/FAD-dependent oxidoreductase [Thalassomonas actiniarum]|uniref:Ferredoxin--NADP reductase n=1 Tax=Thalassomonas actiniarum TaxID=485447 RepID=A0AAE9YRJ9_9GAMM|nr:NAD(P)/FAD-dependent oxidoreductase [Thalassomonas actiniarum]WDD99750.1 NAD(P)/FAD-dependent oxidoreductase [Thalassomonas actiniarum]